MPDCVAFSRSAARVNEPSSQTAMTARTWRRDDVRTLGNLMLPARIYYFCLRPPPALAFPNQQARLAQRRPVREGGRHGSEFRHCRPGLAAARQLGPHAQVPHRAGARDDEEARPRRHALHVRRERALPHRHAHARLEPAQAGPALRHAVRRRRADPVRAGRPRLPDRAPFAVDPEGERPPLVRLDQGRGRSGRDPAGDQVHQRGARGDEAARRRRPEARLSTSSTST